ncbi:unnamed protein product [Allacma fusca]|uniref:C2H2-type domain-containing protein n=1 Tax=Allacma fusca TaxID=39272 RepID=A0A8J2JUC1_9HEXA|nr:unnamed protein product [Allacma fusca]
MLNGCQGRSPAEEPASLLCSQCKDSFHSAWDLMVHVQAAHMLNIYQLSTTDGAPSTNATNARDMHVSLQIYP